MDALSKEFPWIQMTKESNWKNYLYPVNENFVVGKLVSSPMKNPLIEQSEFIEKMKDGREQYVIRYTLATVAGSWIRSQE